MSNLNHCPSYYAATTNAELNLTALDEDIRADVCVIGGGFTGISSAIELAERGFSVVILEQNKIGWGASGRNGGQLLGGINGESKIRKYWGSDVDASFFSL